VSPLDGHRSQRLSEPFADDLTCGGDLDRGRRVGMQASLGQPHAADVGGEAGLHIALAEHHFGRTAAEVHDHERR
jgi:hypothetical protein